MWISLADSIHEIIFIIVKTFDIKSSLPRTPTLLSAIFVIHSIVILSIHILTTSVFIHCLFSIVVSLLVSYLLLSSSLLDHQSSTLWPYSDSRRLLFEVGIPTWGSSASFVATASVSFLYLPVDCLSGSHPLQIFCNVRLAIWSFSF